MSLHHSKYRRSSMLMLDDDILLKIMDFLSMHDCKSLGLSCSRMFGVYQQNPKIVFKRVDLKELYKLPLCKWMPFFKLRGQYISEIFDDDVLFSNVHQGILEIIGTYCINLKSIELNFGEITVSNMAKLFSKLVQLQNIKLNICHLQDNCLLELRSLLQLKKLDIAFNYLTGLHMNCLPVSIESLDLGCNDLRLELFPEICKALPQLKELNLIGICTSRNLFHQLVSGNCCESLESLFISLKSDDQDYEATAMLPSLKKLTVKSCPFFRTQLRAQLFKMLVKHKSKQLEYLEIDNDIGINTEALLEIYKLSALRTLFLNNTIALGDPDLKALCKLKQLENITLIDCRNVSNNAVIQLILACYKLRQLKLRQCEKMTGKILTDIIDKLKQQTDIVNKLRQQINQKINQHSLPIKLYVNCSQITKSMLQNLDAASKEMIDVTLWPTLFDQMFAFETVE